MCGMKMAEYTLKFVPWNVNNKSIRPEKHLAFRANVFEEREKFDIHVA